MLLLLALLPFSYRSLLVLFNSLWIHVKSIYINYHAQQHKHRYVSLYYEKQESITWCVYNCVCEWVWVMKRNEMELQYIIHIIKWYCCFLFIYVSLTNVLHVLNSFFYANKSSYFYYSSMLFALHIKQILVAYELMFAVNIIVVVMISWTHLFMHKIWHQTD
jgi:hypothetical protein